LENTLFITFTIFAPCTLFLKSLADFLLHFRQEGVIQFSFAHWSTAQNILAGVLVLAVALPLSSHGIILVFARFLQESLASLQNFFALSLL
jgi:hypothetical protein